MSRDNRVQVYLDDDELAQIKRWADKSGTSVSHLCREAILEYIDRDRAERIEHEVREMNDKIDRVLSLVDGQHTHTRDPKQQSVPETAREIARTIYRNHEMPVRNDDVELTIEDLGGADDRTIEKYKSQLKKRGLLYKHPVSPVWTDDKRQWVKWQEDATINQDVHETTQEYGMSTTEYTQLAEEVEQ